MDAPTMRLTSFRRTALLRLGTPELLNRYSNERTETHSGSLGINGELELGGSTEKSTGIYSSVGFGLIANIIYKKTNILGDSYVLQKNTFEANAKLIAAAPELLEALQDFVNDIDGHPSFAAREHYKPLLEKAKEAIKKATE